MYALVKLCCHATARWLSSRRWKRNASRQGRHADAVRLHRLSRMNVLKREGLSATSMTVKLPALTLTAVAAMSAAQAGVDGIAISTAEAGSADATAVLGNPKLATQKEKGLTLRSVLF